MKISAVIIIILLTVLNIWSLAVNVELKNKVSKYKQIDADQSLQLNWGFEKKGIENAYLVHSELPDLGNQLNISFFFTDLGCSYCIEHEVNLINKLYENHGKKFNVYLISKNKSFLKRLYDAKFPYKTINGNEKILNNKFSFHNPVAIITDSNDMVQMIHIADKDDKIKSNRFYARINSLL